MRASRCTDQSLFYGKTGMALYFYCLWMRRNNPLYKQYADGYIDTMTESLTPDMPLAFDAGLSGIGWAVDWLIGKGCIEADADEVLAEIDNRIFGSLDGEAELSAQDLLSVAAYGVRRLTGHDRKDETCRMLENRTTEAVSRLSSVLETLAAQPVPESFDILWSYPWALYLCSEAIRKGLVGGRLKERFETSRVRVREQAEGIKDPWVRLMLRLLASDLCAGLPFPEISADDLPDRLSVRNGICGILLLLKLFGKGRVTSEQIAAVAVRARNFVPTENYPYYLGTAVLEGRISLLDGTSGAALALEL